jgi:hypothetical protein
MSYYLSKTLGLLLFAKYIPIITKIKPLKIIQVIGSFKKIDPQIMLKTGSK